MQVHQRIRVSRWALCSLFALATVLLTACGVLPVADGTPSTTTAMATPLPPTSVIVLRFGGESDQNHVAPFDKTSRDAANVLRLYEAVFALPPQPRNVTCRQDRGIGYQLSFMHGGTLVLQVILSGGCPVAAISNPPDCRAWTDDLNAQIAATVGISVTALEPANGLINTAGPNGPYAPYGPTPPIVTPPHCGDQFPTG